MSRCCWAISAPRTLEFALLSDGVFGPIKYFTVAEFARFPDVVDAFFEGDRQKSAVRQAALAVAGPVDEHRCVFTNCPWTIDARELCTEFGLVEVHLCNDFEAAALSLPHLTAADLCRLGGGEAAGGAPMAVLGPGSGLGVACLVPGSRGPIAIATEGGHATMAATSRREDAIIDYLRREFGHVSAERVVSGSGLENLYRAVVAVDEVDALNVTPPPSTRLRSMARTPPPGRRSSCFARCWERSPAMSP